MVTSSSLLPLKLRKSWQSADGRIAYCRLLHSIKNKGRWQIECTYGGADDMKAVERFRQKNPRRCASLAAAVRSLQHCYPAGSAPPQPPHRITTGWGIASTPYALRRCHPTAHATGGNCWQVVNVTHTANPTDFTAIFKEALFETRTQALQAFSDWWQTQ